MRIIFRFTPSIAILFLATIITNLPGRVFPLDEKYMHHHFTTEGRKFPLTVWLDWLTEERRRVWLIIDDSAVATRIEGGWVEPDYLAWMMAGERRAEQPKTTFVEGLLPEALVRKLADTIVAAGFFNIPLSQHIYETGRVEHPPGSGRWFIGESWRWLDPDGYLCETGSCKTALRDLRLWSFPVQPKEFLNGRPYILLSIASGNAQNAWPYDQLHKKDKEMTKKYEKVLKVVNKDIIPFAEKNYYLKMVSEKGVYLEKDFDGPQAAQCRAVLRGGCPLPKK